MKDLERRYTGGIVEMRGLPGDGAVLVGHGAVFNQETVIGASFRDLTL